MLLLFDRRMGFVQHLKHAVAFLRSGTISETTTAALRNSMGSLFACSFVPELLLRTPVISACSSSN